MPWKTEEVVQEKVIDTNPVVWLNAAYTAYDANDYTECRNCLNTLREQTNADEYYRTEADILEIVICYIEGETSKAKNIKARDNQASINRILREKQRGFLLYLLDKDREEWEPAWQEAIKSWVQERKDGLLEKYHENIDAKFFASIVTEKLECDIIEHERKNLLSLLERGGYSLANFKDEAGNNVAIFICTLPYMEWKMSLLQRAIEEEICPIDSVGEAGFTALAMAVSKKKEKYTRYLLEQGADFELATTEGLRPIHIAVANMQLGSSTPKVEKDILLALLEAGADVNAKNPQHSNGSPLHVAAESNHKGAIETLLAHGADINIVDDNGYTPLMSAAKADVVVAVDVLLDSGADITAENSAGKDAVLIAVNSKSVKAFRHILAKGIDINKIYQQEGGRTLLHILARENHWDEPFEEMWQHLLQRDACVNIQDNDGYTPLMYSVDHKWYFSDELDMARALVKHGANEKLKSKGGTTLVDILGWRNIKMSKLHNNESSNFFSKLFD